MSPDYAAVLTANYSGERWSLVGDDYSGLTWLSEGPKPTKKVLDEAWPAVRDARAWAAVRVERNRLLTACDWTQMPDTPLSSAEKQAWADYRQALRDLPQNYILPSDVEWPEEP